MPQLEKFTYFSQFFWLFLLWFLIYLSIYIEIRWGERRKEFLLLLIRTINTLLERQIFLLQKFFLMSSFGIFVSSYKGLFPEIEKGNLVNPLQVIAQLSCFLFSFGCAQKPEKVRRLLLLCFFFSVCSSLHLQGIDCWYLSIVIFIFLIINYFVPLDYMHIIIFLFYLIDQGLARWGFFLTFQQGCYYALEFFFKKEQSTPNKHRNFCSLLFLLFIQISHGVVYYNESYLHPLKLAALLSGACIIFISTERRTGWSFIFPFVIYLFVSIFIGIKSSPVSSKTTVLGIPGGLLLFLFIHVWFFLGLFFFRDFLPRKKQALVPIFISGLFLFLRNLPELYWLGKWIEGIDLLLLLFGIFSFLEERKSYQRRRITIRRRDRFLVNKKD